MPTTPVGPPARAGWEMRDRWVVNVSTIFTIGHSTRSLDEFVALLQQVAVDLLVDVRSFPRSRANPQFNIDDLPSSLAAFGIAYHHIGALGGLRHRHSDTPPHMFWHNASFGNYADYAETPSFRRGLNELRTLALDHCCAIMCAEAVWWRCHRRIISDHLLAEGVMVAHIMGRNRIDLAKLTPGARLLPGGKIVYPQMHKNIE